MYQHGIICGEFVLFNLCKFIIGRLFPFLSVYAQFCELIDKLDKVGSGLDQVRLTIHRVHTYLILFSLFSLSRWFSRLTPPSDNKRTSYQTSSFSFVSLSFRATSSEIVSLRFSSWPPASTHLSHSVGALRVWPRPLDTPPASPITTAPVSLALTLTCPYSLHSRRNFLMLLMM